MCSSSIIPGIRTLHIGRKLWYATENLNAVRPLDRPKEVVQILWLTRIRKIDGLLGEMLNGPGVRMTRVSYCVLIQPNMGTGL